MLLARLKHSFCLPDSPGTISAPESHGSSVVAWLVW